MSGLVAVILGLFVVSGGFLMWSMIRALTASSKMTVEQTARMPRGQRRANRIVGFGSIPFVLLGCIAGIAIRPDPNLYKSELTGGGIAAAIWLAAMTVVTLRSMSYPSKEATTGKTAERAELSTSEGPAQEHKVLDGGGEDLARRRAPARKARRRLLVGAVSLPFALPSAGAYLAHLTGGEPVVGAFVGLIVYFVVVGAAWIGLGGLAARKEWRLHQDSSGGQK